MARLARFGVISSINPSIFGIGVRILISRDPCKSGGEIGELNSPQLDCLGASLSSFMRSLLKPIPCGWKVVALSSTITVKSVVESGAVVNAAGADLRAPCQIMFAPNWVGQTLTSEDQGVESTVERNVFINSAAPVPSTFMDTPGLNTIPTFTIPS